MENKQHKATRSAYIQGQKNKKSGKAKVLNIIKDEIINENPPKGKPYGVCKICGKEFRQDLYKEQNRYSEFDTCHSCRKSSKNENEVRTSMAVLPFNPFPWQLQAFEDFKKHRFSLWALGLRSGKDFTANMIGIWYFIQCLNENRHIEHPEMAPPVQWWILAPTESIAKQNWRDLRKQFPQDWIVRVSDSEMQMETVGGGIIEVRSAHNVELLVGVGLDLVTITEAARIPNLDIVWSNIEGRLNSPGRGLESDRKGRRFGQGKAIVNSTPIGKNFFYTMFLWGQKGSDTYSTEWISYQLPWTCNPINAENAERILHTKYGDITYGEDLRRRMGDRRYRQDYLADFLAMDGAVFKDFDEKCVENLSQKFLGKEEREQYVKDWITPIPHHTYRIGYDPATGSSADSPAIIVRDKNTNRLVYAEDLHGKNYDEQWDEIAYVSRRYNYAECAWLRTGHTAVENQLAKRGVVEIPLDEQHGKKDQYIQSLERAVQNGDYHILHDGTEIMQRIVLQMSDYTERNGKYSNDRQEHDDFVSACYAAWYDYTVESEKVYYCGLMGSVNRYA